MVLELQAEMALEPRVEMALELLAGMVLKLRVETGLELQVAMGAAPINTTIKKKRACGVYVVKLFCRELSGHCV
jgi:hypothetical protein